MQLKLRFMALLWRTVLSPFSTERTWRAIFMMLSPLDDGDSLENGFELSGPGNFCW